MGQDGAIEGLDVLGVCGTEVPQTGLNVLANDIVDIADASDLLGSAMFSGTTLPQSCESCPERETCGGGYLPHRHSSASGFDNPSVWCADLLAFFEHVRRWLDVSPEETPMRRQALRWVASEAMAGDEVGAAS